MKVVAHRRVGQYFPMVKTGVCEVSIQASSIHYCSPKVDGLEQLGMYKTVEIALFADNTVLSPINLVPVPEWASKFEGEFASDVSLEDAQMIVTDLSSGRYKLSPYRFN